MVFESMTTYAKTDDDRNFRFPEIRKLTEKEYAELDSRKKEDGEASSLLSTQEIQEWCDSGLLLPIITNLDTLDMAMIKSLITKQFAGDFFNMGGVPTFEKEQIRNALASAIQMVSTSESPSGKGEEERAAQAEAANGCFTGAAQNTNLPKPNETLVKILKTTGGGTNKTNNNSYDGPLINAYGRPTNSAVSLIQDFDTHLANITKNPEDTLEAKAKSSLNKLFKDSTDVISSVTPTQISSDDMDIPTVKLANALATARLAGNDLDETLIMRLKTEGFSREQIQNMLKQIDEDMMAERYAPEFLEIEGAGASEVIKALRSLQKAYTNPDPRFDLFVKRMVLIRRLLTGEDVMKATKSNPTSIDLKDERTSSLRKVFNQQSPEVQQTLDVLKKEAEDLESKQRIVQDKLKAARETNKTPEDLQALEKNVEVIDEKLKEKRTALENTFQSAVSSETNKNPNDEQRKEFELLKSKVEEAGRSEDPTLVEEATSRLNQFTSQVMSTATDGLQGARKYLRELQEDGQFGATIQNILDSTSVVKLPRVVIEQLEDVRDFQVGLGTRGIFKLDLTDKCAVRAIVINSHYWLTSGLFVQSGAVGDFSNICSTISAKLYSYTQDQSGMSGRYKISQVRSALANSISSGPETKKSAEQSKDTNGWFSGGKPRKANTRRRRRKRNVRRSRKHRRPKRNN